MSHADFGPYTWRDFIELDEDDPRELLDGHLVEIEVPSLKHERIVHRLTFILEQWALPRGGFRPESFEGLEIDLRLLWSAGAVGAGTSDSSHSS